MLFSPICKVFCALIYINIGRKGAADTGAVAIAADAGCGGWYAMYNDGFRKCGHCDIYNKVEMLKNVFAMKKDGK